MNMWEQIASNETIEKTITKLQENGIDAILVETATEAKKEVLSRIHEKVEVMTMTSMTLEETGIAVEINESGKYDSVKAKLATMDRATQGGEMQRIGAAPEYAIGSVHAVTEDGKVVIASNSGSQLPGYSYGADHVIWVVGAHKIVKDLDSGLKRVYDYVLPLESERAKNAYGVPGSRVSKLLIFNKEREGRITLIFVKEKLGY